MREKKFGKRCLTWVLVLMMTLSLLPVSAMAEDGEELDENAALHSAKVMSKDAHDNALTSEVVVQGALEGAGTEETSAQVAKIDETLYETLDDAIGAAQDGDTIFLQTDCTTAGMNLSKNLTIDGGSDKHKIVFNDKGIALWGKALMFQNCNIVMTGIGSTPYAEWSWMAICASKDASLTLDNATMTMDGTDAGSNAHAIYFCSNNKLNLKNTSNLTIKNYAQDALEWDGGDGDYNVNITNSTFISDHNRSGFTGTFVAKIDHSKVDVINSTGNGSNGSNFEIRNDSTVRFNGNGSHGLSVGNLTVIDSKVIAENNGLTGIIFTGEAEFQKANVLITGTKGKSYWNAGMRLFKKNAKATIDKDTKIQITDNQVTGIFLDANSNLTAEDGAKIFVTRNNAAQENCTTKKELAQMGGGIVVRDGAQAVLPATTEIYNNHAALAGDDIYVEAGGTIKFAPVGSDWELDDCRHSIDGWYDDSEAAEQVEEPTTQAAAVSGGRWNAHPDKGAIHVEKFMPNEDEDRGPLALKAAHGLLCKVTYVVTGDIPEGYKAPTGTTLLKDSKYSVEDVPQSVSGTKDGVRGTYSFTGWKDAAGNFVTGELELTEDRTLYGVWTFRRSYRPTPSTPTVEIPDDDALGLNTDDHFAYIIGYPDGTVQPNGQITRAEATTIFFRLLTEESRSANLTKTNGYTDVASDAWYNTAVSTMTKAGIVDGYPDGTFGPDAPITRAEMAKIISLFAKLDKSESRFSDIAGHWAEAYIRLAAGNGWIAGYPDGTFGPQRNITRAETATMINRVLERVPSAESRLLSRDVMQIWPDANPGDWFYLAMQEATNSHDYERNAKWAAADEQWTALRETRDWKALEQ